MGMHTYVTAGGFSHWHLLADGSDTRTRCGFELPLSLPDRVAVERVVGATVRSAPLCEKCAADEPGKPVDGANVHDADAFKAGARFERRQLAGRLRDLVRNDGGGLAFEVRQLANELDPREG